MVEGLAMLSFKLAVHKRHQYRVLNHLLFLFVVHVQLLNFLLYFLSSHCD